MLGAIPVTSRPTSSISLPIWSSSACDCALSRSASSSWLKSSRIASSASAVAAAEPRPVADASPSASSEPSTPSSVPVPTRPLGEKDSDASSSADDGPGAGVAAG
eukprot:1945909-Prymnesium_polylepis.1